MTSPERQENVIYLPTPPPKITYEEHLQEVQSINQQLAAVLLAITTNFQGPRLTRRDWLAFLAATFPYVDQARRDIADAARRFYDSERAEHVEPVEMRVIDALDDDDGAVVIEDDSDVVVDFYERFPIDLPPYEPDWYEEAMDAVVVDMSQPDADDAVVVDTVETAMKEAENGGRRATVWAVERDPRPVGWARVQGGERSCGFCAMLISRGPVYVRGDHPRSAPIRAGLEVADETLAVEIWRQAQATGDDSELNKLMNRWHPGCDCKVVPVFDRNEWPGRDEYLRMEEAWKKHAKGDNTKERFNAFRRYIERDHRSARRIKLPTAA